MAYKIERVTESVELAEGPFWDVETQNLYYVDMIGNNIHRYNPARNEHKKASIGVSTSFIFPLEDTTDKFLISMLRDVVIVTWDGVSETVSNIEKIAEVDTDEQLHNKRLNDGKVDPTGTLWTGTMPNNLIGSVECPKTSNVYSLNKDRVLKHHFSGVQLSNGFSWSNDLKKLYYIDSMPRTVDEFDFDIEHQYIYNRKTIFSFDRHGIAGIPDGQATDEDGNLWVAVFNGSKVIKIDPRRPNTLLETIDMPAKQITSVAFGGKNLDELYVTTACCTFYNTLPSRPANGAVYRITGLGVKGFGGIRARM